MMRVTQRLSGRAKKRRIKMSEPTVAVAVVAVIGFWLGVISHRIFKFVMKIRKAKKEN